MLPFLNLLLTLLFLGSIVFVIYCIALIFARKTKQARFEALKLSIFPIIYITGVLIYSKHKLVETKKEIVKELTGVYVYNDTLQNQDSVLINTAKLTLLGNKTFQFTNLQQSDSLVNGDWDIDDRTTSIQFTNLRGKLLWQGYKKVIADETFIIFNSSGQKIKFIKVK